MARRTRTAAATAPAAPAPPPLDHVARLNPDLGEHAIRVIEGRTYHQGKAYALDAGTAEQLRAEGICDLPGHLLGEPHFTPAFIVQTRVAFEAAVARERAKFDVRCARSASRLPPRLPPASSALAAAPRRCP